MTSAEVEINTENRENSRCFQLEHTGLGIYEPLVDKLHFRGSFEFRA